jgi:hypothetical protein
MNGEAFAFAAWRANWARFMTAMDCEDFPDRDYIHWWCQCAKRRAPNWELAIYETARSELR